MTAITTTVVAVDGTTPLPGTTSKRGLRGAFMNLPYIGPVITGASAGAPASPTHPTYATVLIGAGGAEDSTGHREAAGYDVSGNADGLTGGPSTSVSRPTGRTAYIGAGVPGGSTVSDKDAGGTEAGEVIDVAGRAQSTGKDRFGRTKGTANSGAGLGDLVYTNFDRRTNTDGSRRQLGSAGRTTKAAGETVTQTQVLTIGAVASGVVALADVGAGGAISVDLHADDITGGTSGRPQAAGVQVAVFKRDTGDTDEDGQLVGLFTCDGGTDVSTMVTDATIAGTTVATYVRARYLVNKYIKGGVAGPGVTNQGAVASGVTAYGYGPWSARSTLAVT